MPRLPVQLSNFTGPFGGINGCYNLLLTWDDHVRAAITTGYPNLAAVTMCSAPDDEPCRRSGTVASRR